MSTSISRWLPDTTKLRLRYATISVIVRVHDHTEHVTAVANGPEVQVEPDDVICLLFTSGTTGVPKAVEVTHRGVLSMMRRVDALVPPPDRVRVLSYLPAAHIAERAYAHYAHIFG